MSITVVNFIIEKASKDKMYFATLEPESALSLGSGDENLYYFSYRELVRRNMLKANKEMLSAATAPETKELDLQNLESHLTDADFACVFGKSKEEFSRLAGWKQKNEKKKVFLF